MEASAISSVIETLRTQESELLATLEDIEKQAGLHRANLKRIQDALAALQQPVKAERKKRSKPSKPSASRADVESALMGAKDSNPGASNEELRSIAENSLIEQGFSRSGMALRFKQVIAQTVET